MAQPPPYVPATSFISYQAQQSWFPGQQLDAEFNNLDTIIGDIEANLALIQRDDGALANGSVTFSSLSPTLQTAGLAPLTVWASGLQYAVPQCVVEGFSIYQCAIGHTSGVFSTDLANGDWTQIMSLSTLLTDFNVVNYGADPTGVKDSTAAIQVAYAAALGAPGGVLYFPHGTYLLPNGSTFTNSDSSNDFLIIRGDGLKNSTLTTGGNDASFIFAGTKGFDLRDIGFTARGANTAPATTFGAVNSCVVVQTHCDFRSVRVLGGYYNIDFQTIREQDVEDLVVGWAYGPALVHNGTWFFRCDFDQNTPLAVTTYTGAWAQNTAYTAGQCTLATGGLWVLQCVTGGTSSASGTGPTLANYGIAMQDGTITWQLVAPFVFSGLLIDGGWDQVTITDCDATGPYGSSCISIGAASLVTLTTVIGATPGNLAAWGNAPHGILVADAAYTMISSCEISIFATAGRGIAVASNVAGPTVITNCQIVGQGGSAAPSGSGISFNGGPGVATGNGITNFINGVLIAPNVSGVTVNGNIITSQTSGFGVKVAAGTSDNYNIIGNTIISATTPVSDGGTGLNKLICNSGPGNWQSEIKITVLGVNFNTIGDTAFAFKLPPNYTRAYEALGSISNASASLTSAQYGIFTGAAASGATLVAAGTAITVSATSDVTANNMQQLGGSSAISFVAASLTTPNTIYFRVTNPEGAPATADVTLTLRLLP